MAADVLDRIRKALAMTASPYEQEARTAAMIAAALIREHRVTLALGPPAAGAPSRAALDAEYARGYQRGYDEGERAERKRAAAERAKAGPAAGPAPGASASDARGPMDFALLIESRYDGRCRVCRGGYGVGESIWWRKGFGSAHERCADETFGM